MNSRFRTTYFAKQFAAVFLSVLLCQPAWSQSLQNQMMSFEGTLTDLSGNAVDLQNQQLYFYITANDSFGNKCVLFAESSSSSGYADGSISHKIGNGSAITTPVSYNNVLSASTFHGMASGKLADGSGTACSVSVNATRSADVFSAILNVTASITLGSVPFSQYAANAALLNGKTDTDFLLASSVSGGTTGQVLSRNGSGFSWVNLPAATGGVSSIDLGSASATGILAPARLPSYSGDVFSASGSTVMMVTRLQGTSLSLIAPASGQALLFNGVSWIPTSLGSLATQNSVNLATQATGMLQEFNLPPFNGDVTSNAGDDTLKVTGLQGRAVASTTPANGQILTYSGSQWAPTTANFVRAGGDVLTGFYTVDGGLNVTSTTATNADVLPLFAIRRQTSNPSNGADNFGSMFLFDAENASGNMVNQAGIIARWTSASGEQSQLEFQTKSNPGNMATRMTITGTGKVGIGTNSPNAMLDVQGTIKVGTNGAIGSCSTIETGVIRYNNTIGQLEVCDGTLWSSTGFWTKENSDGFFNNSNVTIGAVDVDPAYRFTAYSSANHLAHLIQDSVNHNGLLIETNGNNPVNYGLSVTGINGTAFIVRNDNRVGVNTNSPMANFHVAGSTLLAGSTDINGKLTVSGPVQLRSPASLPFACTSTEEGTQRYNNNFKVMEFCNGDSWQGLNGVTSCISGFTLIGTPGNPNAYCIDNNLFGGSGTTYQLANDNCGTKGNNRKTIPRVCSAKQLDRACEANAPLTNFLNVYHWTSDGYNAGSTNGQMVVLKYVTSTGACHLSDDGISNTGRNVSNFSTSTSITSRCCYE